MIKPKAEMSELIETLNIIIKVSKSNECKTIKISKMEYISIK